MILVLFYLNLTHKNYYKIGKEIIDKAQLPNIRITCIVGDRLRAKLKGLTIIILGKIYFMINLNIVQLYLFLVYAIF